MVAYCADWKYYLSKARVKQLKSYLDNKISWWPLILKAFVGIVAVLMCCGFFFCLCVRFWCVLLQPHPVIQILRESVKCRWSTLLVSCFFFVIGEHYLISSVFFMCERFNKKLTISVIGDLEPKNNDIE